MQDTTKTELTGILEGIDKEIAVLENTVVSSKAKAQIKNLVDKIENRGKLPDFEIKIEHKDLKKPIMMTLSTFLKKINIDPSKEDKQTLKNLEIRAAGLRALLTLDEDKPVNDEGK